MKTISADERYQSTFMPIIQKAQTRIKKEIFLAFLLMGSEFSLRWRVNSIILNVRATLANVPDADSYCRGLAVSANLLILRFMRRERNRFLELDLGVRTPKDAFMLAQAKGSVAIKDYAKRVRAQMKSLAEQPFVTSEPGKHSISLWQKAEMDVRYEHNMRMIDGLKSEGHDLCYISSHPDCSKRCEPWQGKLVSLSEPSRMTGFRVRKVDGRWVYSLTDIMAQTDKYGYRNNVISGFNCRHRLIPYSGQLPPTEFTEREVRRQRAVEAKIRKMERGIRDLKENGMLSELAGEADARQRVLKARIAAMTDRYKAYCTKNGYAWEKYRISI